MASLTNTFDFGAESGEEAGASIAALESRLGAIQERLRELPKGSDHSARLRLDEGALLLELERNDEAWGSAREAFDYFTQAEQWEQAVIASDILFEADQAQSLAALGQGVWLAVTFPIDPELTCSMLRHVVEDTPDDADGAAVAAATAAYVVDLRAKDKKHKDLSFFATQMLGDVARRHSDINDQTAFDAWVKKLELDEPGKFLVRLRNVVDVLVQDEWWIDREAIQAKLPDQ